MFVAPNENLLRTIIESRWMVYMTWTPKVTWLTYVYMFSIALKALKSVTYYLELCIISLTVNILSYQIKMSMSYNIQTMNLTFVDT